MDETKTYIKMCNCPEIQEWYYGMVIGNSSCRKLYLHTYYRIYGWEERSIQKGYEYY